MTARGAGLATLLLLTITVCCGALANRARRPGTRVIVQYVHRATASLGLGVLTLHVATILADSLAHVGVTGALVPFSSSYRATWVGLGTIAAYLVLVVSALGLARGRMANSALGAAIWRRLHGLSYGAWGIALVHGFLSGSDSGRIWVRLLYLACIGAVVSSIAYRSAVAPAPSTQPRELVSR
jgi:sulfoxide reductase heme-binding subunit YedZ